MTGEIHREYRKLFEQKGDKMTPNEDGKRVDSAIPYDELIRIIDIPRKYFYRGEKYGSKLQ